MSLEQLYGMAEQLGDTHIGNVSRIECNWTADMMNDNNNNILILTASNVCWERNGDTIQ